jgi:hypothetical protein
VNSAPAPNGVHTAQKKEFELNFSAYAGILNFFYLLSKSKTPKKEMHE